MKKYAPKYFNNFKCIMDECRHNCCIGWEIDIDEESKKRYNAQTGVMGDRLKKSILQDENGTHFMLGDDERCPFLNENNLCDIIINLGESALCQICADHPRFINFYDTREEIGLGLCCEAAAELILKNADMADFAEQDGDEYVQMSADEEEIFALRDMIWESLKDNSFNIWQRMDNLMHKFDIDIKKINNEKWARFYLSLERLDDEWTRVLDRSKDMIFSGLDMDGKMEREAEAIAKYFVYRYFADGMYDFRIKERLAFAYLSTKLICAVCVSDGAWEFKNVVEMARMYSAEIEYCEKNVDDIISKLTQYTK